MSISDYIALLGGVSLFLFGMAFMGENLKKVAGNKLELILYRLSNTPLRGILLGTGVCPGGESQEIFHARVGRAFCETVRALDSDAPSRSPAPPG